MDLEPQHQLVQRLWEAISNGEGAEDVLDILSASGVRATPSFMLLWLEQTSRGFLRGAGILEVSTVGTTSSHSAEGYLSWAEVTVDPDASEFVLQGPESEAGPELPMASGVTMAARVVVAMTSAAQRDTEVSPVSGAPSEPTASEPTASEPTAVGMQPSLSSEPRAGKLPAEGEPADLPDASVNVTNASAVGAADAPPARQGPSYDYLFGATTRPAQVSESLAESTVKNAGPIFDGPVVGFGATAGWHTAKSWIKPDGSEPATTGADASSEEPAERSDPPPPGPESSGMPRQLIDGVPWLTAGSASKGTVIPAQPAASPPSQVHPVPSLPSAAGRSSTPSSEADSALTGELGDAERTVNRAALLANTAHTGTGPTVLASRCPAGHLSPSHSATCRVCRAAIPVQQPFEVVRPALGVLRLSTGDTVTLDRGVLIGRKPAVPVDAAERPHLVRVHSPEHDVSRQHAEIILDGWQVYVRDLGSTNGTTVTLPGQSPQRLREGELQLLEHATVIVLADEIRCVFEVRV